MATTKPRITITLNDKSYAVLKAISDCSGQPMSTFVAEMLDSARPTLERMAATFQTIKRAQDAERSRFLEKVDEAQAAIEPVVMQTLGQFDLFLGRIEQAVDRPDAAQAAPSDQPPPQRAPLTNRGDTPRKGTVRKASNGKASGAVRAAKVLKKSGA
jgi:hypothetical protein